MSLKTSEQKANAIGPLTGSDAPLSRPQLVRERYVLVNALGDGDEESDPKIKKASVDVKTVALSRQPTVRLSAMRGISTRGHRPQRLTMCMVYDTGLLSSAAATAYNTVLAVKPSNCTEWTNASTLFDECRCSHVEVHVMTGVRSTTIQQSYSSLPAWGIAWDPSNSAACTGVGELLVAEHHIAPAQLIPATLAYPGANTTPVPTPSMYGTRHFGVDLSPDVTLTPAQTAESVGGSWFGTGDSGIIVGYLKPYVEVAGPNNAISDIRIWHVLTLHFRSRS